MTIAQAAAKYDKGDRGHVRGVRPHHNEAKNEIMCLHTNGMPESISIFRVEATNQVYNQTNKFVCLREKVNHNAEVSIKVGR